MTSSRDDLRRSNLSAVLSRVHASGPTSRTALTAELGLNRSTIGDLTGQLERLGLVKEVRPTRTRAAGRPSHLVVPRTEVTVIAVLVDVKQIVTALVGLGGTVLHRQQCQLAGSDLEPTAVAGEMAAGVNAMLARPEAEHCLGIGVSVPGVVRSEDGLVRFAPNLGWQDVPFLDLLRDLIELPLALGNDSNLGVFAEHLRGAAVGIGDVAYVSGSVGIGGGFLVGGIPLRGAGGYAGEIGHLQVESGGITCRCGARGCWETRVGENHILAAAGVPAGGGPAAVAAVIEAAAHDAAVGDAVDGVAHWLGVGLRTIVNVLNPQVIVLGGVLAQLWTARTSTVQEALSIGGPVALQEDLVVLPAGLGDDSSLIGAAELAFAPLLADPLRSAQTKL